MTRFILDRRDRKIPTNPDIQFAIQITKEAEGYDEIVTIGGGSTIDVGKYVSFCLGIPHMAIPTTAGTGSEVTKYAVLTSGSKKLSFENDLLIPYNYVHNPRLLTTCPDSVTASCGLDALSQAIESDWVSPSKEAKKAIRLIMRYLVRSYKNPTNLKYRSKMLTASMNSGLAINKTKTSICHAISYPLTTHYDIPHGIACALSLPYFMRLFDYRYLDSKDVEKLVRELNIAPERVLIDVDRELVVREALESERAQNTPIKITKQLIKESL